MFEIQTNDGVLLRCPNHIFSSSSFIENILFDLDSEYIVSIGIAVPLPFIESKTLHQLEELISLHDYEKRYDFFRELHNNNGNFDEIKVIINGSINLKIQDIIDIGKIFVYNYKKERYESSNKPESSKKRRPHSDFLNAARINIQAIANAYLHYKRLYGNDSFIIFFEVDSVDEPWSECCTIRETQAKVIKGVVLKAYKFTKENDLMSILLDSETDKFASPFLFINFKTIGYDITELSRMAENYLNFVSLICHSDEVFGKISKNTVVQFKCGKNHKYCKGITQLAEKNKFYQEDIKLCLRGSNLAKPNECVVILDKETVIAFCFYRKYKNNDLYIAYFFVSPDYQKKHFGANLFYYIVETQELRPKTITLISKSTEQARYFWFSKMKFSRKYGSDKGTKHIKLKVVDDFLKLLKCEQSRSIK